MSDDPLVRFTPENISAALKGFYTPPKPGNVIIEGEELISLLETLPSLSVNDHVDPILVQLARHHPGPVSIRWTTPPLRISTTP